MQLPDVDEFYEENLRGKTEDEILKVIQDLKRDIPSLERKVDEMEKEEEKERQEEERNSLIKRLSNWYWYKVKHLDPDSYELGCVRICLDYDRLYLERAELALAEVRGDKKGR